MPNFRRCLEQELPDSLEPVDPVRANGFELHTDGDFSLGHRRFRPAAEIVTAIVFPWTASKSPGRGQPLMLVNLHDGSRQHLQFIGERWQRRLYWRPVVEHVLHDAVLLLAGAIHILPTLHQFRSGEPISLTVESDAGTLQLKRAAEPEAFLELKAPNGPVRRFADRNNEWYEIHTSWLDVLPPTSELQLRAAPAFTTDLVVAGKSWLPLESERCLAESGSLPGHLTLPELPQIQLGELGQLVVQNCAFPPHSSLQLHFRDVVVRRQRELVQLDFWQGHDGEPPRWHSFRLRSADTGWQLLLDEIVPSWWDEYGDWVVMAFATLVVAAVAVGLLLLLFELFPFLGWILDEILP